MIAWTPVCWRSFNFAWQQRCKISFHESVHSPSDTVSARHPPDANPPASGCNLGSRVQIMFLIRQPPSSLLLGGAATAVGRGGLASRLTAAAAAARSASASTAGRSWGPCDLVSRSLAVDKARRASTLTGRSTLVEARKRATDATRYVFLFVTRRLSAWVSYLPSSAGLAAWAFDEAAVAG